LGLKTDFYDLKPGHLMILVLESARNSAEI